MATDRDGSEIPADGAMDGSPSGATEHAGPGSPTEPDSPGSAGSTSEVAPEQADGPGSETASRSHPSTGVPTGTAPRAVLRPVPEGFPTPPPRPARPNRAPALPAPEPEPRQRPRHLALAAISAVVLVLVLGIGGGVIAVRALSGDGPAAEDPGAPAPSSEPDPARSDDTDQPAAGGGPGLTIGEVTVTEVSTRAGLTELRGQDGRSQPEGEYVVVTIDVDNASERTVIVTNASMQLETADGDTITPDTDASEILDAPTQPRGTADAGESTAVHAVFDVPVGAEPASVHIELFWAEGGGTGELTGELTLGG